LALAVALLAAGLAGAARADIPVVQHVVIVFQENRSPDNLFHGLPSLLPQADIADSGLDSNGQTIVLTPAPLANTFDPSHNHLAFTQMYDNGQMNGADLISCTPQSGTTCPPDASFEYVNPSDVAPYFFIATNYGFANRMFQSNQGPSWPAHQFIIGGTTQPSANSLFFGSDNPNSKVGTDGCDAAPKTKEVLVGPGGMVSSAHPCFEHATLTDLIDNPPAGARQGLSWRYYAKDAGGIWTGPDAIRHMCQPAGVPATCKGPDWTDGKIVLNPPQVLTDIQQNNLASVSWVIPNGYESDHASGNQGLGPSWVASIINAIGESPYWNNTVILVTWDDWGGWYDHVPPPIDPKYGYYENGFRVPLLVVSAYTPAGYVSQQTHTFGSILKFIETAFGLPLIPPGTFVDSRADDLSDFFNFNQAPQPFVQVPAPLGAEFFIHDKRPPTDPDTE
jgi:phospholipase C